MGEKHDPGCLETMAEAAAAVSRARPPSLTYGRPLAVYVVDDGEQHWIAAMSEDDARRVMVEIYGETDDDSDEAAGVSVLRADATLRLNLDDSADRPRNVPDGARVYAEFTAEQWCAQFGRGLIMSTCY